MEEQATQADGIPVKPPPKCPTCGKAMHYYGGTGGFICCGWKLLYRAGGWLDGQGSAIADRRLQ